FLTSTLSIRRVDEPAIGNRCRGKKKGRKFCGLSLSAPGPPGVQKIILDFAPYAKSPAECLGQARNRRPRAWPCRAGVRARLDRRHRPNAYGGRPDRDERI